MGIQQKIKTLRAEYEAAILDLLSEGLTYQRAAEQSGCSITTVVSIAKRNGIKRNNLDVKLKGEQ